jgi:hypothetical protein
MDPELNPQVFERIDELKRLHDERDRQILEAETRLRIIRQERLEKEARLAAVREENRVLRMGTKALTERNKTLQVSMLFKVFSSSLITKT